MKIVTITGYKGTELGIFNNKNPAIPFIKKAISREIIAYIEEGAEWFIISGQLGVELWAAEEIFALKDTYPEIKLGVFAPFYNQEGNWNEENTQLYNRVLASADYVDTITKREYEGPWQFQLKNNFFISKCDALLVVYDENNPASPKFIIEVAKKAGKEITFITMDDLQNIVNEMEWNE
ncbi:MAG: DUF1273 domain-containing protein [Bacillaceae bacterium]